MLEGMNRSLSVIFNYARRSKFGINALVGAMETEERLAETPVHLCYRERELLEAIGAASEEVVIVGFSFCTPAVDEIGRLVKKVRRAFGARVFLLAGGPQATADPGGTLRLGFDAAVLGEGEATFVDLLLRMQAGAPWREAAGIAFLREDGSVLRTGRRPAIDLEMYPAIAAQRLVRGPIEITRGCPHLCAFCQTGHIVGVQPRRRGVEHVARCVPLLRSRHCRHVRLMTPDAFAYGSADGRSVNLEAIERLLARLADEVRGGAWLYFGTFPSEVRPEHVTAEALALVRRYAHNDNLVIGAQSGSPRLLELCRRGHSVREVYAAVERTLAAGLWANVDFIFGFPDETDEDVAATLAVIGDLVRLGARIHAHTFLPLPQTPFANRPPRPLKEKFRQELLELESNGSLYGQWRNQEEVAEKLLAQLTGGKFPIR